jgi:mannosyltransferase OCH1-like enzyme
MIPKRINQVLIVDGFELPVVPPAFARAMDSFKIVNPDFEYRLFSGSDCRKWIEDNYDTKYLNLFDKLIPYTYKCDFFRLLLLLKEGGWYCDARQVCLEPLQNLTATGHEFYAALSKQPNRDCMESAFMGVVPGHPILKKSVDLIVWNIEHEHYGLDCIYPTGPGVLFQGAIDYIRRNPTKCCIGQVVQVSVTPQEEYIIFFKKKWIRRKYNDASGADNSDIKGTNHYGDLWRSWNVYKID